MPRPLFKLDPSNLPGTHRSRVFVGGSYAGEARPLLDDLAIAVVRHGFNPIIADRYQLVLPEQDIHDVTLSLLHSCRLAIFEASTISGALMEIERAVDYGVRCLVLYKPAVTGGWKVSRMLSSFVEEHSDRIILREYAFARDCLREADHWLKAMGRMHYVR